MKKLLKRDKRVLLLTILLGLFVVCIGFFYVNTRNSSICVNPFELKDSSSARKEIVRICNNTLYRGSIKVVSKNEYPDLFEFILNKDSEPDKVVQKVRVFEEDKQEYVSIISIIDYASWNNSSIGIYRKEKDKYTLVFKKSFKDNPGRWVDIEFGEDSVSRENMFALSIIGEGITISGDIGYLGCSGGCRMLWWDFYDWDSNIGTFVLANNKHPENFKRLLEDYEQMDQTTCQTEANVSESITNLYPIRKDKEKICSDDVREPATSLEQAKMLLKGKRAIELIIKGENISNSQVDKIEINN